MEDQNFWDLAFISIASIRLHPKNLLSTAMEKKAGEELAFAAHCADVMLRLKKENLKWVGSAQSSAER